MAKIPNSRWGFQPSLFLQVDVDAGGAVGVAQGKLGEGFGDTVQLILASEQAGHVIHLHEDVLLQRVIALSRGFNTSGQQ